jgi:hypothetical protein
MSREVWKEARRKLKSEVKRGKKSEVERNELRRRKKKMKAFEGTRYKSDKRWEKRRKENRNEEQTGMWRYIYIIKCVGKDSGVLVNYLVGVF